MTIQEKSPFTENFKKLFDKIWREVYSEERRDVNKELKNDISFFKEIIKVEFNQKQISCESILDICFKQMVAQRQIYDMECISNIEICAHQMSSILEKIRQNIKIKVNSTYGYYGY